MIFAQWVGGQLSENKIDGKDISYLFTQPDQSDGIIYKRKGRKV
jgi:hypothetical protein